MRKWLLVLLASVFVATCIAVVVIMTPRRNHDPLSLYLDRDTISRADFFDGKMSPSVRFTNNTDKPIEFLVNGVDCFQFLDIKVVDEEGKNHTVGKYGNNYVVTLDKRNKQVVKPGETFGGSVSISIGIHDHTLHGTFYVQAFLNYEDINLASNIVKLTILP
jgi:hypothetical protein